MVCFMDGVRLVVWIVHLISMEIIRIVNVQTVKCLMVSDAEVALGMDSECIQSALAVLVVQTMVRSMSVVHALLIGE